jgi:hypothetical protein
MVRAVQAEAVRQAAGRLADLMTTAVGTFAALLDSPDDRVRLAAAREVMASAGRVRDQYVVEERLAALEAQAAKLEPPGGPE